MAHSRIELQKWSRLRLREARLLLTARLFAGAYHIAGFSIECALKACVAKSVARFQVPEKKLIESFYTHDFSKLVHIAGIKPQLDAKKSSDPGLDTNWTIALKWNPEFRYQLVISKPGRCAL